MEERARKRRKDRMKRNWLISLGINVVILAVVLLLTGLSYETDDDFGISLRILEGYDNVLMINMYLCKILIPIQAMLPGINVFVCMQMLMSFVAFTTVLKLLLDQGKSLWFTVVCVLVITVFAFDHYSLVQFTKTSALLAVAGVMILADAVIEKRNPLYYLLGLVLVYTAACLRFVNVYVAIGFAALYLLVWVIHYQSVLRSDGYFHPGRIVLYVLTLALLCGTYGLNYYSFHNSEISDYSDYNRLRANIIDYPVYQNYGKFKDELKQNGISKNDLYLIDSWYLDYDGAASYDNLKRIEDVYLNSDAAAPSWKETAESFQKAMIKSVRDLNPTGVHIIMLVLLAAGGILCLRPRYWPYIFMVGAFTILLYLYLFHIGRTVYRASYIADLGAALWLIYYYYDDMQWRNKQKEVSGFAIWERRVLCVMGAFLFLAALYPMASFCNQKAERLAEGVMAPELTEYLQSHEDRYYVFSTREKDYNEIYLHPEQIPAKGFEKNMICFGGWGTESEFTLDHMKAYGLKNVFSDIINNEDVYVVEQKNVDQLEKYFNKWYGSADKVIYFKKVDEVAGQNIWQVLKEKGPVAQTIRTPQKHYGLAAGAEAFNLNAHAKTGLSYRSSNEGVARVFEDGVVQVLKEGTAKIRIEAKKNKHYKAAAKTVTVQVSDYVPTSGKIAQSSEDYDEKPGDSSGTESKIGEYSYDPDKNWKSWQYIVRCTDPQLSLRAAKAVTKIVQNEHFGYNGHYPTSQEEVDQRRSIYDAVHDVLGDDPSMQSLDKISGITTGGDTSCTPTLLAGYWLYIDMSPTLELKWHKPYDKKKYRYYCGTVNVEYHQLEKAIKKVNETYTKAGKLAPFQLIEIPKDQRKDFFKKKNIKKNLKRGDIICSCPDYNDNGHTAMML